MTTHQLPIHTIGTCVLALLTSVSCSMVSAQDRFPPPGQGQAGLSAMPTRMAPTQNSANAFPSQSGMQQRPVNPPGQVGSRGTGNQSAFTQQPQNNLGAGLSQGGQPRGTGGGFRMPAAPGQQAPGQSSLAQKELQDYGVPPTSQLHAGAMHGPTPVKIPGGRVTTTDELAAAMRQGQQAPLVFHVLGGQEALPNAQYAAPASAPGNFNDETQRAFSQYLGQVTRGQKNQALVFYCASTQCWMSYNAALRAINSGYSNVLWYRGGIEAWKAAGLPTSQLQ